MIIVYGSVSISVYTDADDFQLFPRWRELYT